MRRSSRLLAILGAAAAPLGAQGIGQGFELERAGRYEQAATYYLSVVRADPVSLPALLGLERVLAVINRLPELLPLARQAVEIDSRTPALQGLLLRTFVGLEQPDSAQAMAARWAAAAPRDPAPYREWALALEQSGRRDEGRRALLQGRRALGPTALAIELAELLRRAGDWEGAAREWATAVTAEPAQVPNAASQLGDTPAGSRAQVAAALTGPAASVPARQVAAELALKWGDAAAAWTLMEGTLTPPTPGSAGALRRFADLAAAQPTPEARRVRGLALGRFADLVPAPLAARARADAARALIDAGDRAAARVMLERLGTDPAAPPDARALARAAVIEVMIEDGQLDAGGARLVAEGDRLPADERTALHLALARARIARGELARADSALGADSGLDATAMRGWIALYGGDLHRAAERFRAAGPYTGERGAATERSAMLALLQQIPRDRFPELGAALLLLARGDSAPAVEALVDASARLGGDAGWGDVRLLAGRVAARLGDAHEARAAALFAGVVAAGGTGAAAPAAELEWGRLLVRQGRPDEAIAHLEHLILTWPASAVVPEARREIERARGAIPRS